jgi:hypothetical protein
MSDTMNRIDIVQQVIDHLKARNYLEIGVKKGKMFLNLKAPKKLAVDPVLRMSTARRLKASLGNLSNIFNEYYEMTSDRFFSSQASRLTRLNKIDVAFIDGLHTYRQSLADVQNCLKHLNQKGIVLMHDCNPQSDLQACPADSREHAARISPDGNTVGWSGDVWKTIVNLRSNRSDLDIIVLDCDHGIGVITFGKPDKMLQLTEEQIMALSYQDLAENRKELINLTPPEYIHKFLKDRQNQS